MTARTWTSTLSRRTMLRRAGLYAAGTALNPAVGSIGAPLAAASSREDHPIVGAWLAVTPLGPAELVFDVQGGVLAMWPHSGDGPTGYYEYITSAMGIWCPVRLDTLLMSVVACEIDADGTVTGLAAIMGQPVVSDDGGSFQGNPAADRFTRTLLDGTTTVVLGINTPLEPLSGIRMWPESSGRR